MSEHPPGGRVCVCGGPYGLGERCQTCGGVLPEPNAVGKALVGLAVAVPVALISGLLVGVFVL